MDAVEHFGYKNSSVESIAKSAGIAKGTFYHFFSSKEQFFYEIILIIRDKNREEIIQLVTHSPQLDWSQLTQYFIHRYTKNKTVYHYFSVDELQMLSSKLPEAAAVTSAESNEFAAQMFSQLSRVNHSYRPEVAVNMMNVLAAFSANRALLAESYYDETVELMARALAGYILITE